MVGLDLAVILAMLSPASLLLGPCGSRCNCGLEPSGKANGNMSHAEYFSTHWSLIAPFAPKVDGHGLSRLPRIFFGLWVPLTQLFLALGFAQTQLDSSAQVDSLILFASAHRNVYGMW